VEHNEILELYQKYVDPTFLWKNFTQEEQAKILLSGRSNNELETTKLQQLYPKLLPIRERVELLFQNWNKSELVQS
jgi:UDP-glucose 4,6-dehydratase